MTVENLRAAVGNDTHSRGDRGLDSYPTPPEAVRALLGVERLPERIWEPACGAGNIVDVLRRHGRIVVASDIVYRGCPDSTVADFMTTSSIPPGIGAIVTNPPFYLLKKGWVERCLALAPMTVLLLRLNFLAGESRRDLVVRSGLARVHVFDERLPMMHREGWEGPRASSRMDFAWFVWDRSHRGPPRLHRVSWRNPKRVLMARSPRVDGQIDLFTDCDGWTDGNG